MCVRARARWCVCVAKTQTKSPILSLNLLSLSLFFASVWTIEFTDNNILTLNSISLVLIFSLSTDNTRNDMTYQSRSSRIKSLARNDDSIYWSTIDSFSNVTDVTRSSSRQSTRTHSRNYIDPWDLENYAYIQR